MGEIDGTVCNVDYTAVNVRHDQRVAFRRQQIYGFFTSRSSINVELVFQHPRKSANYVWLDIAKQLGAEYDFLTDRAYMVFHLDESQMEVPELPTGSPLE